MNVLRLALLLVAMLLGGWLAFDGSRALFAGDYTTAKTGPHAGELGPWAKILPIVGIPPRSLVAKIIHVALGLAWLGSLAVFSIDPARGRNGLLACSILSLWYLPFGTVFGLLELVLLFLAFRKA